MHMFKVMTTTQTFQSLMLTYSSGVPSTDHIPKELTELMRQLPNTPKNSKRAVSSNSKNILIPTAKRCGKTL